MKIRDDNVIYLRPISFTQPWNEFMTEQKLLVALEPYKGDEYMFYEIKAFYDLISGEDTVFKTCRKVPRFKCMDLN